MQNVVFRTQKGNFGGVGFIILNRPEKMNAISYAMFMDITKQLLEWRDTTSIQCVVIESSSSECFCAGGDLQELFIRREQTDLLTKYFFDEYRLIKLLSEYPKPIISILDGYTMGGGVGLGMHVKYPFITQKFIFAMPETLIGLFPDVGGRYLLANLPCHVGFYLALTSSKIDCQQAEQIGLINYKIDCHPKDFKNQLLKSNTIEELESFCQTFQVSDSHQHFDEINKIDKIFSKDNMEDIISELHTDNSVWSQQVLQVLSRCSPLSLKITLMAMGIAKDQKLEDCLFTDYRIVNRMLMNPDFFEGVRAKIIDKDSAPVWTRNVLEQISQQDVFSFFAPLEREIVWI